MITNSFIPKYLPNYSSKKSNLCSSSSLLLSPCERTLDKSHLTFCSNTISRASILFFNGQGVNTINYFFNNKRFFLPYQEESLKKIFNLCNKEKPSFHAKEIQTKFNQEHYRKIPFQCQVAGNFFLSINKFRRRWSLCRPNKKRAIRFFFFGKTTLYHLKLYSHLYLPS